MFHFIHSKNINRSLEKAIRYHLFSNNLDFVGSSHTHIYNVIIVSDNCEYDFDFGSNLWFTNSRWNRLVNSYIDKSQLQIFIRKSKEMIGRRKGTVGMNFIHQKYEDDRKVHKWGGCLHAINFRIGKDNVPELILFSRTCFMGYMSFLDAGIIYHIAKEIYIPEKIRFIWHISDQQISYVRMLPYIFTHKTLMDDFEKCDENDLDQPLTLRNIKAVFRRNFKRFEDEYWSKNQKVFSKYGATKRLQKKYLAFNNHEIMEDKLIKSVNIRDLKLF